MPTLRGSEPTFGRRLTAGLSLIKGFMDSAAFVAVSGLFTAKLTSNFVLIGAVMVHPGTAIVAKRPASPLFAATVAGDVCATSGGRAGSRPRLAASRLGCAAGRCWRLAPYLLGPLAATALMVAATDTSTQAVP